MVVEEHAAPKTAQLLSSINQHKPTHSLVCGLMKKRRGVELDEVVFGLVEQASRWLEGSGYACAAQTNKHHNAQLIVDFWTNVIVKQHYSTVLLVLREYGHA